MLAITFAPGPLNRETLARDIVVSTDIPWGEDRDGGDFDDTPGDGIDEDLDGVDIVTVALHEFGHALGIAHVDADHAVLNANYRGSKQALGEADRTAIESTGRHNVQAIEPARWQVSLPGPGQSAAVVAEVETSGFYRLALESSGGEVALTRDGPDGKAILDAASGALMYLEPGRYRFRVAATGHGPVSVRLTFETPAFWAEIDSPGGHGQAATPSLKLIDFSNGAPASPSPLPEPTMVPATAAGSGSVDPARSAEAIPPPVGLFLTLAGAPVGRPTADADRVTPVGPLAGTERAALAYNGLDLPPGIDYGAAPRAAEDAPADAGPHAARAALSPTDGALLADSGGNADGPPEAGAWTAPGWLGRSWAAVAARTASLFSGDVAPELSPELASVEGDAGAPVADESEVERASLAPGPVTAAIAAAALALCSRERLAAVLGRRRSMTARRGHPGAPRRPQEAGPRKGPSRWRLRRPLETGPAPPARNDLEDFGPGSSPGLLPLRPTPSAPAEELARLGTLIAQLGEQLRDALCRNGDLEERCRELECSNAALVLENARWAEIAATDSLTGLKNRKYFREALEANLRLAEREGVSLSLVMLDVDRFKSYNDAFGHPAGDDVLCVVAEVLRENARPYDVAARYGGEEFVLLLPGSDAREGRRVAERVREALGRHDWPLRPVTASFGVATLGRRAGEAVQLIAAADEALYRAKGLGRDFVVHHNDPTSAIAVRSRPEQGLPPGSTPGTTAVSSRPRSTKRPRRGCQPDDRWQDVAGFSAVRRNNDEHLAPTFA